MELRGLATHQKSEEAVVSHKARHFSCPVHCQTQIRLDTAVLSTSASTSTTIPPSNTSNISPRNVRPSKQREFRC
eukprot:m.316742 g.316742  ORF g.316742 m.316742 type:complete len:75 (-) comp16426_c2_seq8:1447-1671(-)